MNDIDPNLARQLAMSTPEHALSITMGIKPVNPDEVLVHMFDGGLFSRATIKELATAAFGKWLGNDEAAKNWEVESIKRNRNDGPGYENTRYVTMKKVR